MVGGKPILAWTAFGVIMFELTMLFAGVANFLALVLLSAATRRGVALARAGGDEQRADRRWWFQANGSRVPGPLRSGGALEEGRS